MIIIMSISASVSFSWNYFIFLLCVCLFLLPLLPFCIVLQSKCSSLMVELIPNIHFYNKYIILRNL